MTRLRAAAKVEAFLEGLAGCGTRFGRDYLEKWRLILDAAASRTTLASLEPCLATILIRGS